MGEKIVSRIGDKSHDKFLGKYLTQLTATHKEKEGGREGGREGGVAPKMRGLDFKTSFFSQTCTLA